MAHPTLKTLSRATFDTLAKVFKLYHDSPDGKLSGLENEKSPYEREVLDIVFSDPSYEPDCLPAKKRAWLEAAMEDIDAADEHARVLSYIGSLQTVNSPVGIA